MPPVDLACRSCWQGLTGLMLPAKKLLVEIDPFPVYSLFLWQQEWPIGHLLYALKQGGPSEIFHNLARDFLSRRLSRGLGSNCALVPSPPRRVGMKDHAWSFAVELGKGISQQPINILNRDTAGSQKTRDLAARQRVQMSSSMPVPSHSQVVFVDDVLTTGSTAKAAYKALGRPQAFEVWTLAYRPKILKLIDFS